LKEWAANGNNPETPQELYNLRHAIARNVIERIWALIKMRWATLRASSFFGIKNQVPSNFFLKFKPFVGTF
jgi:hypothetical protein